MQDETSPVKTFDMTRNPVYCILLYVLIFSSCRVYRPNILFKTDSLINTSALSYQREMAEKNYKIQINDRLKLRVYTNEGERIIDPDYELVQQNINPNTVRQNIEYFVQSNGMVKFPMVGMVPISGLTLREAEEQLQNLFNKYYFQPYVTLEYINKRVIVLGATGGQVIPLQNENMNLIEVLALAGGVPNNAKAYNIRLIRGDLKNPAVQIIDLSTIEGMKKADLKVYPGDIIYMEPVRKIISESLTDLTPFLSLILSVATLIVLINTL